ncbi:MULTISPECIES: super-infection exclusion protein B [Bacillus subtilis group]|uniref:super-infection exclusion protein B n=1 Tax=Bacillus subtilis group TaxID=653685 RepID=UPI001C0ED64C|nr:MULTISPECIES: super-infection exclusion protein B [Bacillus subtilis group]MBU5245265.1 superinfection exclusion B family protein [Bacillus halotolerans]UJE04033.1 super-infection exclusion protein B [Bacillus subtilis]UPG83422.1 superinfection exclusion B family protein [Bacillus subtilis]
MEKIAEYIISLKKFDTQFLSTIFIVFSIPQIMQITLGFNIQIPLQYLQVLQLLIISIILYRFIKKINVRAKIKIKLKKKLSINERNLLNQFLMHDRKTMVLNNESWAVNELVHHGMIIELKESKGENKSFYKIDDWTEKYLKKNPEITTVYIDEIGL